MADSNQNLEAFFKESLECGICNNLLSDPRELNCTHSYCAQCLVNTTSWDEQCNERRTCYVSCPSCSMKTVVKSVDDIFHLKVDVSVARLITSLHTSGLSKSLYSDRASDQFGSSTGPINTGQTSSFCLDTTISIPESPASVRPLDLTSATEAQTRRTPLTRSDMHDLPELSSAASVKPLRSSGFVIKAPVAPNQIFTQPDSSNFSLAFSSEYNTTSENFHSTYDTETFRPGSYDDVGLRSFGEHTTDVHPVNVMKERVCEKHPPFQLDKYCITCKIAICRDCSKERDCHFGHEFCDLSIQAEIMRRGLAAMVTDINDAVEALDRTRRHISSSQEDTSLQANQLDSLKTEIQQTAETMMRQITESRDRLLEQLERVRSATSDESMEKMKRTLKRSQTVASVVEKRGDDVDVVSVFPSLIDGVRSATSICAPGGPLDRFDDIQVRLKRVDFLRKPLEVGELHEKYGWKIFNKINIPSDKRGQMQGMTSLPNGRLAVGYVTGGLDFFSASEETKQQRILNDTKIIDLVSTSRGTLIVYPMYGTLCEVTQDGQKLSTDFYAPKSKGRVSMSTSTDGRMLLGYADTQEIHQFSQSGGAPINVTSVKELKPQQLDMTGSGKLVAKDKSGVKIFDLESCQVDGTIKVGRGQFAYPACDVKDNIYVAMVSGRDGVTSIAKYNHKGKLVETVCNDLTLSQNASGDYWLRLVSISPSLLAACDGSAIFIYRRLPSALELADDMRSLFRVS